MSKKMSGQSFGQDVAPSKGYLFSSHEMRDEAITLWLRHALSTI